MTAIAAPQRPADLPTALPPLDDLPHLVSAYGIAVPRAAECATPDQAVEAATAIGFPVVLKGSVAGVTHKTELQAVKTGLKDAEAVTVAWQDIAASIAAHGLTDAFTGCAAAAAGEAGAGAAAVDPPRCAVRPVGDGGRRRHAG